MIGHSSLQFHVSPVVPAERAQRARAGIQYRAALYWEMGAARDAGAYWMPAFAGMTIAATGMRVSPGRVMAILAGDASRVFLSGHAVRVSAAKREPESSNAAASCRNSARPDAGAYGDALSRATPGRLPTTA
jgi:hypothetical protein